MKILWFTNTVSAAEVQLEQKSVGGGWIKSLDRKINGDIDLNVAFYHTKDAKPFSIGKTRYYPIYRRRNFIGKFLDNHLRRIELKSDTQFFLDVINEVKPDLIHIHGTENPFGYILTKTNVPIVISIQGIISVIHYKYFYGMSKKLSKLKFGLKNILLRKSHYQTHLKFNKKKLREQEVLRQVKYIIGRTDFDRRVTRVLAPQSLYFHVDEILRDPFYLKKWGKKREGQFVIHSTMNSEFYKGLDTISESIILLAKHDIHFMWQIAGIEVNDPIVKTVVKKVGGRNWLKYTNFLGILDENAMTEIMLQADVFVLASHIENSPNSLCEAMLMGLPIISTMIGGVSSMLTNNKDGLFIQDGDPWSMSGAILEILNSYNLAVEFGRNARKCALLQHDPDKIMQQLINVYDKIINDQER